MEVWFSDEVAGGYEARSSDQVCRWKRVETGYLRPAVDCGLGILRTTPPCLQEVPDERSDSKKYGDSDDICKSGRYYVGESGQHVRR